MGSKPTCGNPTVALIGKGRGCHAKGRASGNNRPQDIGLAAYFPCHVRDYQNVEPFSKVPSLYEMRAKVEPCNLKERRSLSSLPLSLYIENLVIIFTI